MKSKELGKRLDAGQIDNLYLFYGEEDYIKDSYIDRIKSIVLENDMLGINFTQFDEVPSKDEFSEAVESAPMMCDKKIVLLNEINVVSTSVKKDFKDALNDVLENIPEYTVVIIKEKERDSKKLSKPMLKLVQKNGVDIECARIEMEDMMIFINRQFSKNKKRIRRDDLKYLISICEPSVNGVLREVEVICAYLNEKEEVTREVIDLLVKKTIEDRVFQLSDAIINKDKKTAYDILADLKLLKQQHPAGQIFSLVCEHFVNMYIVICNNSAGIPSDVTVSNLKLNGRAFLISKYLRQQGKLNIDKISEIIILLDELDRKIKIGSTDPYYAIEQIIAIA